jgi:hypothetical protein
MPILPTNPDALREDLREKARADIAAHEAALAAEQSPEPEPFDPVKVVRQMQGLVTDDDSDVRALVREIRLHGGYSA